MSSISIKPDFAFPSLSLPVKEVKTHPDPPPLLLLLISSVGVQFGTSAAQQRAWTEHTVLQNQPAQSRPRCWLPWQVLPLCKWCCSTVVTLTIHALYICTTSQPAARIHQRPTSHHRADDGGEQIDTLWTSSK